jgi:uncharacterized coiled-coil protein SlyX
MPLPQVMRPPDGAVSNTGVTSQPVVTTAAPPSSSASSTPIQQAVGSAPVSSSLSSSSALSALQLNPGERLDMQVQKIESPHQVLARLRIPGQSDQWSALMRVQVATPLSRQLIYQLTPTISNTQVINNTTLQSSPNPLSGTTPAAQPGAVAPSSATTVPQAEMRMTGPEKTTATGQQPLPAQIMGQTAAATTNTTTITSFIMRLLHGSPPPSQQSAPLAPPLTPSSAASLTPAQTAAVLTTKVDMQSAWGSSNQGINAGVIASSLPQNVYNSNNPSGHQPVTVNQALPNTAVQNVVQSQSPPAPTTANTAVLAADAPKPTLFPTYPTRIMVHYSGSFTHEPVPMTLPPSSPHVVGSATTSAIPTTDPRLGLTPTAHLNGQPGSQSVLNSPLPSQQSAPPSLTEQLLRTPLTPITLKAEVVTLTPALTLRIPVDQQAVAARHWLNHHVRVHLPEARPLAPTLTTWQTKTTPVEAAVVANKPDSEVLLQTQRIIGQITEQLPHARQLLDPQQLATAMARSGTWLEAMLANRATTSSSTEDSGILKQDIKAQLLRAADQIRTLNQALTTTNAANNRSGSSVVTEKSVMDQLQRDVDSMMKHVVTLQLKTMDSPPEQMRWAFGLPFQTHQGIQDLEADIQRDVGSHEEDSRWRIRLQLDLPRIGPLTIDVALQGHSVNAGLFAEQSTGAQLLQTHLQDLRERLEARHLDVVSLHARQGQPPAPRLPHKPQQLINEKA